MGDKDKLDEADTPAPYDDHTTKTKVLESLSALLERDTEDSEPSGTQSGIDEVDEADPVGKDAGDDDAASRIARRLETITTKAMLEEVTDGTTGRRRYRLKWPQRVLTWFRRH